MKPGSAEMKSAEPIGFVRSASTPDPSILRRLARSSRFRIVRPTEPRRPFPNQRANWLRSAAESTGFDSHKERSRKKLQSKNKPASIARKMMAFASFSPSRPIRFFSPAAALAFEPAPPDWLRSHVFFADVLNSPDEVDWLPSRSFIEAVDPQTGSPVHADPPTPN